MNEFDPDLHERALKIAQTYRSECGDVDYVVQAYLDLRERRGLPPKLICEPDIQLASGGYFNFDDPDGSPMLIEDIASALSKVSRYAGHTVVPGIYSIAQHSVLGARNAPQGFEYEVLMHDAHEFVIGDMTTPFKQLCPDFKGYEKRIERSLRARYGLPLKMTPEAKEVDIRMCATEKRDLMLDTGDEWPLLRGVLPYPDKIEVWDDATACLNFLLAYEEYRPK